MGLDGRRRLLADPGYRLEHAFDLAVRRLGDFLVRTFFAARLASGTVLPAFAIGLRLSAGLGRHLFTWRARGSLALPATTSAPAASAPRSLAGLRAAFLFGFGAFRLDRPAFGGTIGVLLVVMVTIDGGD